MGLDMKEVGRIKRMAGEGLCMLMETFTRVIGLLTHGQGTYYHSDGSKYEGQWEHDRQHGHGLQM